ncbi:hypothetical protein ACH5AO_29255 [Streptomyces sp. NPDC018964]|uniref:DUF6197 family protein n=1 Tax=Streptomyces sp. NPDC018964 TaxID=3365058 RepID=UPI0037A78338
MSTTLYDPALTNPTPPPEQAGDDTVFQRSALLIARRGWCQGQGLLYIGSPHDPQAASLAGALAWAATGDAQSCGAEVRAALAAVRARLDPHDSALFSDWELVCAWNDAPSRTREQTIALLRSCRHPALPSPRGDDRLTGLPEEREAVARRRAEQLRTEADRVLSELAAAQEVWEGRAVVRA